ncbi:MAG: hypothetical protein Q8N56_00600, partial [bacterium]|nr:hypothetical protein [bacterium]
MQEFSAGLAEEGSHHHIEFLKHCLPVAVGDESLQYCYPDEYLNGQEGECGEDAIENTFGITENQEVHKKQCYRDDKEYCGEPEKPGVPLHTPIL